MEEPRTDETSVVSEELHLDTVQIRAVEEKLDEAFCSLRDAWEKQRVLLDDVEESVSYFHEAKMKYLCSKDRLAICKATIEEKHFSNATKRAPLRAETLMLKQHQNIANEELRISQLKQRLNLETQLAKLEAEGRVCLEFKTMTDGPYNGEHGKALREMSTDDITAKPLSFLQAEGVLLKICPTHAMSNIEKTTKKIPVSYKSVIEPRTRVITTKQFPDDETVFRHPQVLNTRSHDTSLKKENDALQQPLDVSPSSPVGSHVDVPSLVMNPHAPPWRPKYDCTLMANDRLSIDVATLQQLDEATGSQPNDVLKDQQRNSKDGRNANNSFSTTFGGAYKVSRTWLMKIMNGPQIKHGDGDALQKLADVRKLVRTAANEKCDPVYGNLMDIHSRQQRKQQATENAFGVGDIVLIADTDKRRHHWELGIVSDLILGSNKLCRAAVVQTKRGRTTRSIIKLYPLEAHANAKDTPNELHQEQPVVRQRTAHTAVLKTRDTIMGQLIDDIQD
eukprot:gene939-252_t